MTRISDKSGHRPSAIIARSSRCTESASTALEHEVNVIQDDALEGGFELYAKRGGNAYIIIVHDLALHMRALILNLVRDLR